MNYFKISRFFLYLIPLGVIIISKSTLFPFIVGKYVWFRTLSAFALIFFLLGLLFDAKASIYWERFKKIARHPLFISVGIFVLAFVVSGFFGIDPHFSFWSSFERGEGGLQMLHFFAFFALMISLFKDKKNWQKMFWIFILSAYLMILYGVGAGFGMEGFLGPQFDGSFQRFQGSIGNPAYVAIYLVFAIFFAGYLLSSEFKKIKDWEKVFLFSSIAVFLIFFFLAATRGAFLGLAAGVFVYLLHLGISKKEWRKQALSILFALLIIGSLGIYFRDTDFVESIPGSRIFDISISEKTFQHRAIMWGTALEGWKERPIFGWGSGNYLEIFQQKYDPDYFDPSTGSYGAWFDQSHSVVFDYLSQTGIVGFLSYLGMFIVLFWQISKAKLKEGVEKVKNNWSPGLKSLFLALPVAYLVQGLVLFDISTTYLSLFVFFAFAVYKFEDLNKN
jgi:O-antigen ligase